jgi:hypothetical protein
VSTVGELQDAISARMLRSGDTILMAPGTYTLDRPLVINGTFTNVTLRGATNHRGDVVIAAGEQPFGIWTGGAVTGLTMANLTITNARLHAVIFNAGTQAPRVYNVRLVDAGQQFIKSNPTGSTGVDHGMVESSVFEYTTHAPTDYTNGIDVLTGRDWIIRHHRFIRMRAPQGQLAGPAILMWKGSSGTIVDGNTFIDCQREISVGLEQRDQEDASTDHRGGLISNNFIYRHADMGGDVGIAVFDSPHTQVVHNTVVLNGAYPHAIEVRFSRTTGVRIVNNLSDGGVQARNEASLSQQGNIWTATEAWFVSPATGDLHLRSTATLAIDRGVAITDAAVDWDGQPRSGVRDVGADEYIVSRSRPR